MIDPQPFRDAANRTDSLHVADLLDLHGRATLPALLLVSAVLSAMPVMGLGTVLSFVLFAIAWHWPSAAAMRRDSPTTTKLRGMRLEGAWCRRCLRLFARMYDLAGQRLRRRWLAWRHPRTTLAWRLWIAIMALVILLPLPLGNLLPGLSLVLLALGWIYKDGAALVLSVACGTAALGVVALSTHVLVSLVSGLLPA